MISRDVESLVNCSWLDTALGSCSTRRKSFQRSEYENDAAAERLDAERSVEHRALRRTVSTASLQIVLLSKSLLNHVALNANDPLGKLLHTHRVMGLFLGVDQFKDINQLHKSGNFTTLPSSSLFLLLLMLLLLLIC